jgi:dihydroorotate dehydrogenase (NAD+) catalytic subunit
MSSLKVDIAGITLPNPVMPASGTYECDDANTMLFSPSKLGAIVNKTVFLHARTGNPPPRLQETPCGMLNAIGIPTEGIDVFMKETLPKMASYGVPIIVSVAGSSVEEYCTIARIIADSGKADLIELNLSCPNLQEGIEWSRDDKQLYRVVKAVAETCPLPVIAKLSPAVTDIAEMAGIAEQAGASALALINTYKGIKIDINKKKPVLGNVTGGLSGPAIRPLAVYAVWSVYERTSLPIIGMGGVCSWEDAVELMLAGATAVGVGMYNFVNPMIMKEIIVGLSSYAAEQGIRSIKDIIGAAH